MTRPRSDTVLRLALVTFALTAWLLALAVTAGCAHCPPAPDPVPVEVPIDNPGTELPLAELPAWRTPAALAGGAPAGVVVKALALDLVDAWRVIATDRHTIEAHNATIASPSP